jgi:tetratricopeptide (TPR) repeat protein
VVLLVITVLAVALMRRAPYLLVGWLWYLGTLVPTIGIIPVGFHSIADRYTYVPLVGVFVLVVWAVAELSAAWPFRRRILTAAATLILLLFTLGTWMQARHWRNTLTLFGHAVNVSTNNALAHYNLGLTLQLQGRWAESIRHYRESTRLQPGNVKPRINLAYVCNQLGLFEESTNVLADVLRRQPGNVDARLNLGVALSSMGRHEEAMAAFEEALRVQPDWAAAHFQTGRAWERQERFAEAIACYEQAVVANDEFAEAWLRLAWLRAAHPEAAFRNPTEALEHARRVGAIIGDDQAAALLALAVAQGANHDFESAVSNAQRALELAREDGRRSLIQQCEEVLNSVGEGRAYTDGELAQGSEP